MRICCFTADRISLTQTANEDSISSLYNLISSSLVAVDESDSLGQSETSPAHAVLSINCVPELRALDKDRQLLRSGETPLPICFKLSDDGLDVLRRVPR